MRVTVVTPPDPIVMPEDISGDHDEGLVTAAIQAATEDIDGPDGWLGRALGPQTLEATLDCWGCGRLMLPCRPIISVDAVSYVDMSGAEQAVGASNWSWLPSGDFWFAPGWSAPALAGRPGPIRILYQAGYDGENTGLIPMRAKQAVILMAQDLLRTGSGTFGLRSDTVEGVGAKTFMDGDRASAIAAAAVGRLLAGLRVYA